MADKITEGTILGVGVQYENTKGTMTKVYLKVPNPKETLDKSTIVNAVNQFISGENPIFVPDEDGPETFDTATAVFTAYTEYTKKTEFDIGIEK